MNVQERFALAVGTSAMFAMSWLLIPAAVAEVRINEIRVNQSGADNDEFFELKGDAGESLSVLSYIVIGDSFEGYTGVVEAVVSLSGQTIGASGYFIAAESTFTLGTPDLTVELNFENDDNVTHLLVSGFTGGDGDDLDTDDDGVLDVEPWTAVIDSVGLVGVGEEDEVYSETKVGPDGSYVPGGVYRCEPDGTWIIASFEIGTDTPGSINLECPAEDTDGDGLFDYEDNCPYHYNPDQADCDEDGMGDVCEIADGFSQDCNDNGIPDVCDLIDHPEWDADGDGLIDDCYVDPPTGLVINEIRIDQPGTDTDEYVELKGDPGTSLEQLRYLVIGDGEPGDSGVLETVIDLDELEIPADGLLLAVEDTFTLGSLGSADLVLSGEGNLMNFENSDNVTHLLVANFFGSKGQDLDADDDGVLDEPVPWLHTVDSVALVENLNEPPTDTEWWYGDTVVGPDGEYVPGQVYRCVPDGEWWIGEFGPDETDTPGEANPSCNPDSDGDGFTDDVDNCPFIYNPDQLDCDEDGMGDVCAIADAYSQDCNGNGIPDECDLVDNPDWDADGDGLIDECYVEPPTDVVINEIRIDQIGSDNDEYFELFGPSGTSLDGVKYIVIGDGEPGDSGVIEAVIALDGLDIPGDGLFLTVEDTYTLGSVFDADYILSGEANLMNFENSDNVTHMLVANFFGGRGQDLDADDDGEFDAPGPWLDTLDMVALVESLDEPPTDTEWWYGQTVVGPDGEFAPGHVYRCVPEGDWLVGPFDVDDAEAADTPGAVNPDCPEPECPADITGDGVVDVLDILEVLAQWGGSGSADITGNGVVDVLDLLEVLAAWGPC